MPRPAVLASAAAVALIAVVVFALVFVVQPCACDDGGTEAMATVSFTPTAGAAPPSLPTACKPNPAPAVNVAPTEFGYRKITSPAVESPVSPPLHIAGDANPFEGLFMVTIYDRQGREVAKQLYRKDNTKLDFDVPLSFEVTSPMPACVWVYELSGKDGTPTNVTQIPVLLVP